MKRYISGYDRFLYLVFCSLISVVLFFAVLGDALPSLWGSYNDQRILLLLFIWLIPLAVLSVWFFRSPSTGTLYSLLWLVPTVVVFASGELYKAEFGVEPLFFVFYFTSVGLLGSFLVDKNYLESFIDLLLFIAGIIAFLYSAVSLMIYGFALSDGVTELYKHIPWGVPQYRYWSHLATWMLPLMPLMANQSYLRNSILWKVLITLTAGVWWWIIFLSMARGSAIAILVGGLVVLLLFRKGALTWLKSSLLYLVLGAILWLVLSTLLPNLLLGDLSLHTVHASTSGRTPQWVEAFTMSLENFPFGMGPQSWITHTALTDAYGDSYRWGHPHNMYLLWAAEYGWICILALALVFCKSGSRVLMLARETRLTKMDSMILVGFTSSVIGALTHAGVSAVFMGPASMLVGLLILSAFWALVNLDQGSSPEPSCRRGKWGLKSAWMLSLVLVLVLGGWWAGEIRAYYSAMVEDSEGYTKGGRVPAFALPRFWLHGDFPRGPRQDLIREE
ncbi:O-antigen ligase family protein [Marinobacter salsuginis]|uniref:O-antigen ligase family protein n=1 Tax=Marinobacter salsuginis TaxID=418719 RepID=UPI00273E6B7C|nr:O-antigen ligase family protein [Marinobacter salsuginis]